MIAQSSQIDHRLQISQILSFAVYLLSNWLKCSISSAESAICAKSEQSAKSLPDFERRQAHNHEHDGDDIKARNDFRLWNSHHLKMMMKRSHPEYPASFAVLFFRVFEIQPLDDHRDC